MFGIRAFYSLRGKCSFCIPSLLQYADALNYVRTWAGRDYLSQFVCRGMDFKTVLPTICYHLTRVVEIFLSKYLYYFLCHQRKKNPRSHFFHSLLHFRAFFQKKMKTFLRPG